MGSGLKIMCKAMECNKLIMEAGMKACGIKTYNMGMEKNSGLMALHMKVTTKKA